MSITQILGQYGLIPVVVINDKNKAVAVANALELAELPVMEVTLRTPDGLGAIENIRAAKPDYILGAGTVLTLEQCKAAVAAGASYIVSPGINREIVDWCLSSGVDVIPGGVTPTEVELALAAGLRVVKFFPASTYGGINGCKALFGPYASTGIKFVPTGGINLSNLADYADKPFIHAVGGGWLVPVEDIDNENYSRITENAAQAVAKLLDFELVHVGINQPDAAAAQTLGREFAKAFGWGVRNCDSSVFTDSFVEIMKQPGRGAMGHLAVRTNNVDRAIFYLTKRGYEICPESVRKKKDRTTSAYLQKEFGGFAVHLLQR